MRCVRVSEKMSKAGWRLGLGKKTQQISVDKLESAPILCEFGQTDKPPQAPARPQYNRNNDGTALHPVVRIVRYFLGGTEHGV